ncbi:hypothetical protein J2Z69_000747 [Paenibacillus shirakamiensis]|uniref:Uncharacterized protein n=1 Tax=Paenibacillus shirakamiensis TaxID=1265935 RepID=A0ABS4JDD5_9BACL|nr:hypothetical protein [Paenibacillus shirakamiensis]MBP1999728.1 hypothetical protein [Paenibacillus shirakamiensis]
MDGWIKLHRKILDNPVVCKDSDYAAVWMYLLLNATHKEYPAVFSGERILLQPGQLLTGRITIAEKFNIHESKVQRILKSFEIEQQIEQQTSNKKRLISILSWSDYQTDEQQNEHPVNNKRTTTEQQVNTNKNVKNLRTKELKEIKDMYSPDFESFWNAYPRKIGKKESAKKFESVIKSGEDSKVLIRCATNYKNHCERQRTDTQYIKHPKTFLNEERYKDYMNGGESIETGGHDSGSTGKYNEFIIQ